MRTSKMSDAEFAAFLSIHPVSGAFDFGEFGDSSDTSPLSELIQGGVSLGSQALQLGANPTNLALYQGQSVYTPQLQTNGNLQSSFGSDGGINLFWIVVLGVIGYFAFRKV